MTDDELTDMTLRLVFTMKHGEHGKKTGDMTEGEKSLLAELHQAFPKPMTPGDLSLKLRVGSGRIANALKTLERKGYVIRRSDKEDRRRTLVSLTDAGYAFIEDHIRKMKAFFSGLIAEYGARNYEEFLTRFEALIASADRVYSRLYPKGEEDLC